MAPQINAAETLLQGHEERIQRLEEEIGMTSKDLATQTAYQKSLFKTIEKMESNLSVALQNTTSQIDGKLDLIVSNMDRVRSSVEKLEKRTSTAESSIRQLEGIEENEQKTADKGRDFKLTLIGGLIVALASGAIGYFFSII